MTVKERTIVDESFALGVDHTIWKLEQLLLKHQGDSISLIVAVFKFARDTRKEQDELRKNKR